jgi:FkbM family methyltransferase
MRIAEKIRRISYSPLVGACIRRLGLRKITQRLYANLRGNPGAVKLSLNGIDVLFSARTPLELRCVEGAWFSEREMLGALLTRLRPGDVFLDIGSNLGIFTILAAKAIGTEGTVIACEPETTPNGRLEKNIQLKQFGNIRVLKLALSDKCSNQRLLLGDPGAVSQSARLSDADGPSEEVQTASYDSLVAQEGLPIPRVVKMDIEGHEYAALKGMAASLSDPLCVVLFCEIHPSALPDGATERDVLALIESFGFETISTKRRVAEYQVIAVKHTVEPSFDAKHGQG